MLKNFSQIAENASIARIASNEKLSIFYDY